MLLGSVYRRGQFTLPRNVLSSCLRPCIGGNTNHLSMSALAIYHSFKIDAAALGDCTNLCRDSKRECVSYRNQRHRWLLLAL